jgi:coenzyme F420-reducing hydrogenase beta subunit
MSLNYKNPEKYIGPYHNCYIGYSSDENIRNGAASGGIVSSILIYLLKEGEIDGALVSKQVMADDEISYKTFIARTKEEILNCRTSIYMNFPLEKHFKEVINFNGRVAIVALPCQLKALKKIEKKYPQLKEKIILRISLFCSGQTSKKLIEKILEKNNINLSDVKRIYFRKGLWKGNTYIEMRDGNEKIISYLYYLCTYRNLYFYSLSRCYSCQDQFGYFGDISCGDIWLDEYKGKKIKYNAVIVRKKKASDMIKNMVNDNVLRLELIDASKILQSQKRALIYKFNSMLAKKRVGKLFGLRCQPNYIERSGWNHYIAAFLIGLNIKLSNNRIVFLIPNKLMFLYMCFLRSLLSF